MRTLTKPLVVFRFSGGDFQQQAHSRAYGVRVWAIVMHPEIKPISAACQHEEKKNSQKSPSELRVGGMGREGLIGES